MAFKLTYTDGQESQYDDDTVWEVDDGVLKLGREEGKWSVLLSPSHWAVIEVGGAQRSGSDDDEKSSKDEDDDETATTTRSPRRRRRREGLTRSVRWTARGAVVDRRLPRPARRAAGSISDPTQAVVEGIAYTREQLSHDRYLRLVVEPGNASAFTAGSTSNVAIAFGRSILELYDIDWTAAGFVGDQLDDRVEFIPG